MKTNNRLRPRLEKTFQTTRNTNGILLQRGDNFGDFNFGSTIVLVFEAPDNLAFNVKPGDAIRLGQSLCYFDTQKNIDIKPRKQDNESTSLDSDDSESSHEDNNDDATVNINQDMENNDQSLLIDTVALDAAIADADAIADQEVISNNNNNNEQMPSSSSCS